MSGYSPGHDSYTDSHQYPRYSDSQEPRFQAPSPSILLAEAKGLLRDLMKRPGDGALRDRVAAFLGRP